MYAAVFLLACALTGLTWSFDWYKTGFYKTFGVEQTEYHRGGDQKQQGGHGYGDKMAEERNHGNKADKADFHKGERKGDFHKGEQKADFHKGERKGDFHKGEQKQGGDKMRSVIYSVHTGTWGGIFSRIITFLAALLGASLPLTGYYIWIKRLRK
jgi:uncharacterized iron-regulated membrane protein